ncbi:MAG: DUF6580 family putative transport protein [Planctomycetota bacterium]
MKPLSANSAVFALLVAIGVVGRLCQPDWCVTPMAAVGLLAGYWFRNLWIAALAPVTAMALSDLVLASYGSALVQLSVYGSFAATAVLGRVLSRPLAGRAPALARLGVCVAAPSMLFFLVTNFATWAGTAIYPITLAGLAACYTAAVPFYRPMLAGDVVYATLLLGAAAAAGVYSIHGRMSSEAAARELA